MVDVAVPLPMLFHSHGRIVIVRPGHAIHLARDAIEAVAIAVVTGEAIALGIFLTHEAMAKSLGSPLLPSSCTTGAGVDWVGIVLCRIPFRKFLLSRHEAIRRVQPHNG